MCIGDPADAPRSRAPRRRHDECDPTGSDFPGSPPPDGSGGGPHANLRRRARESPPAASRDHPRMLGRAGVRLSVVHPVATAPRRPHPGHRLRRHRGHRVRPRCARSRRSGAPSPTGGLGRHGPGPGASSSSARSSSSRSSFALGQYWQSQIRALMEVTEYSVPLAVASPLIAAVFFALLILVGRGLRGLYRWTVRLLDRLIGSARRHAPWAGSSSSSSPSWSSPACCSTAWSAPPTRRSRCATP